MAHVGQEYTLRLVSRLRFQLRRAQFKFLFLSSNKCTDYFSFPPCRWIFKRNSFQAQVGNFEKQKHLKRKKSCIQWNFLFWQFQIYMFNFCRYRLLQIQKRNLNFKWTSSLLKIHELNVNEFAFSSELPNACQKSYPATPEGAENHKYRTTRPGEHFLTS